MHGRAVSIGLAVGMSFALPVFAANVNVHTSASTHVSTNGSKTETTARTEYNGVTKSQTTTTNNGDSPTVNAGSYHSISCHNGDCTERKGSSTDNAVTAKHRTTSTWRGLLNNVQARIALRICRRLGGSNSEACLNAAAHGEGTIRARLRSWIESHQ